MASERENLILLYANNNGADQPAHTLISALVSPSEKDLPISATYKVSICSQGDWFERCQVANPGDRFVL